MQHAEPSPGWRNKEFDYVFLGAGCAGLSLLMHLIKSGLCSGKKILLIDKAPKEKNDRTWCFWEKEPGFFEEIVCKTWGQLDFFSEPYSGALSIAPYRYKMIRGIDFYRYCFGEVAKHPNIRVAYGDISGTDFQNNRSSIIIDNEPWNPGKAVVFNSIYTPAPKQNNTIYLLQHFKGWVIESANAVFNPLRATLMDFRVEQTGGARFVYVLPLSEKKALVEYTLFTEKLLEPQEYNAGLKAYIAGILKIDPFTVTEEEYGVIPMTNEKFEFCREGIYQIGTAGGQTKASTGYTFRFIQKQSQQIADCLLQGKPLRSAASAQKRFGFYDSVLLRLLERGQPSGAEIFSRLFRRNKAAAVFKFLDNETTVGEELKIIRSLPALPFLKAAISI